MSFFIGCDILRCEYRTRSKKDLKHHFKTVHRHRPKAVGTKYWYCNSCEYWYAIPEFKEHEKTDHSGENKWLQCQDCGHKFSKLSRLRYHTKRVHKY